MDIALIIIGSILIILLIRGVFLERKKRLSLYDALKNEFGTKREKKYKYGKNHLDGILKRYGKGELIDEITWNDLDMETVFERIDKCKSAVGEEYLYAMLHTEHPEDGGKKFDELVSRLQDDQKERTDILMSLSRLGYVKGLSPFDYLDYLTEKKSRFPIKHILTNLLYLPAIALIFFKPIWGGIALFLVVLLNIFLYFRYKKSLSGVMESIGFVIRLSREGLKLIKGNSDYLKDERQKITKVEKLLRSIIGKGGYLAVSGSGGVSATGNPLEIFLTYFNMIFHIDLIQFDLLIGSLAGKKNVLEYLLLLFGRLDAAISVADFRASLNGYYCKPRFSSFSGDKKDIGLTIENGYHPLVEKFVSNSISAKRGVLLTGSNASGKSTFLRMVAVNAILAQSIYTVCAKLYVAPAYNIYSSIALKDNLLGKESYFIVEIKSVKRILTADCEKYPVLCFIDEVLRGTNTVERISASETILKYFSQRPILCFAATHDSLLADILAESYDNYHFSESVENTDVYFDYTLKKGKAVSRNAINLLKSYGYPEEITDEAEIMAHKLDSNT
ncbi:MAG: hypothetical protein K5669_01695 [Lachnospiraceae bacterium]|nr:hypothetical protein [Lachnospiraceae bacterium]